MHIKCKCFYREKEELNIIKGLELLLLIYNKAELRENQEFKNFKD